MILFASTNRLAAAVLGLSMVFGGCATGHATKSSPPAEVIMIPDERLGPGDVFEVRVLSEPDFSGKFRVAADGAVDYPYAGRLRIAGLEPSEVQRLITEKLRDGYINNPQVSIQVTEWNSRKISVLGQVARPGPISYFPQMTIVDALTAAGGFTSLAAKNSVRVRREKDGKVQIQTYRVGDITEGTFPNVTLLPGDVVTVEERLF